MSEKEQPRAPAGGQPGSPPVSRETKNKRSSFFVYLAILFGAAFLMLLLAYFVQRRNNATAMDDLRSSSSASREELLDEIDRLEGELAALREERDALEAQRDGLQRQKEELEGRIWRERELEDQLISYKAVLGLENDFRTGDYDRCAVFFENALTANHYATPPDTAERVEEIYWALVEKGLLNEEDHPLSTILGEAPTPAPEMG